MYRIVVRHEKALGSIFFRPFAEKTLLNGNRRESTARVFSKEGTSGKDRLEYHRGKSASRVSNCDRFR
ncbi:hypothetical protein LEP1GSC068_1213 [Leptospira sp. Fiocruz LV3954]|nr:hypothetical protein LEP1GSC068_1213 [Leptospira sp. Fiocruz LV3954]EMI66490.1 hypothetical protein LEP1GSC076_3749 [Leptospira sp. Fiocruz LV4135]